MLADSRAPRIWKSLVILALCSACFLSIVLRYGQSEAGALPGFLVAADCFAFFAYLGTGVVLLGEAKVVENEGLLLLGVTYLVTSSFALGHLVATLATDVTNPSEGMIYWTPLRVLWDFWHGSLGVGVIYYAWNNPPDRRFPRKLWPRALGATLAAGLVATVPIAASFSPSIFHWFSLIAKDEPLLGRIILAIDIVAFALIIYRRGSTDRLSVWLSVIMLVASLDVALTVFGGRIYTLAWYAGRVFNITTSLILLIALIRDLLSHYNETLIANVDLHDLAMTDALTGLANRRAFDRALEVEFLRARRESRDLSLLIVDLDHFKKVNDHLGHAAGDKCLVAVGAVMGRIARRPSDLAARTGGEEFALLLPNTSSAGAQHIAQIVRAGIEDLAYPAPGTESGHVTASVGVTTLGYEPRKLSAAYLVESADAALYTAKTTGRNRVAISPILEELGPGLRSRSERRPHSNLPS